MVNDEFGDVEIVNWEVYQSRKFTLKKAFVAFVLESF